MAQEGKKRRHKQQFFTGEWIPDEDPLKIGEENYADIQNLRFKDVGVEGVLGYSKINTSVMDATYQKGRAGIQLRSPYSGQSRVLVQAYNAALSAAQVLENKTTVPNQGNFEATELHTDASGAGRGRFARWPLGNVAYCNGKESQIYAGDELRCSGFINYDPDGDFRYDFSEIITNEETDATNVATLARVSASVDANTKLLLHLDNNVTDAVGTHTPVNNGSMAFSTTNKVFGTHAAIPEGTDDYIHVPDHADFDFSGGTFTVDLRVKLDALPGSGKRFALYQHETAGTGNDWFEIYIDENGAVWARVCEDNAGSPDYVVSLNTVNGVISAGTAYHIEVVESGNDWYIFVDGTRKAYASDASRCADYTGNVQIGYNGDGAGNYLDGMIDETRVSDAARHTSDFDPPGAAYGAATNITYALLGSTRPLKGFKAYIGTANTTAGTLNVQYWNGTGYVGVSNLSDGTASGGVPLAQTGTVSFDSTASAAKVKAEDSIVLYWYRITITDCDATTTIYQITANAPFQAIKDVWDGVERVAISFQVYDNSTYNDYTLNVLAADYSSANNATFAALNSLGAGPTDYFVCGFDERMMGIAFTLIGGSVNTNAAILTVSYWDGDDWQALGGAIDGTLEGNVSFRKSGVVTWDPPADNTEFRTTISKEVPLYYYKFEFSAALSADVKLDYVGGITAQRNLSGQYKFPFMFQNRPMLCGKLGAKEGHRVDYGMANAADVHNGEDSSAGSYGPLYFGDSGEDLVAACEVYNRFGSSIYNIGIFCKLTETYTLEGYSPSTWQPKKITDKVGCVAWQTMDTAEVAFSMATDATRNIAAWLSFSGPVIFDGATFLVIKGRISNYFKKGESECINWDAVDNAVGWLDPEYSEYNLCIPTGSNTTPNVWLVIDLVRRKWFRKVPNATADQYVQAALKVVDTNGEQYIYGLRDNAYMMRLENGNDWDGQEISCLIKSSDQIPSGDVWDYTKVSHVKLLAATVTEDTDVTVKHYTDGEASGVTVITLAADASNRYTRKTQQLSQEGNGYSHTFEISFSTGSTSRGVPLLGWGFMYEVIREDTHSPQ